MNKWPMVKMGDVCEKVIPKWDRRGDREYVDISSVSSQKKAIEKTVRISGESAPSRAQQVLNAGDVLVSTVRPNLNAVALVPDSLNGQIGSTGFCVLRAKEELSSHFLFHFTQTQAFIGECVNRSVGISYPSTTSTKVRDIRIPLPPLEEQKRIAGQLNKLAILRQSVRQKITQMGELRLSLFQRLIVNDTKTLKPLGALALKKPDYGIGASSVEYSSGKGRYIRITDIDERGELSCSKVSPGGDLETFSSSKLLEDSDLLFARSGATVGKTYLHSADDEDYWFAGYLIRFKIDPNKLDPKIAFDYCHTPRYYQWVKNRQQTAAQPNISAKVYAEDLFLPVPSRDAQNRYLSIRRSMSILETKLRKKLDLIDELYESVQARSFSRHN